MLQDENVSPKVSDAKEGAGAKAPEKRPSACKRFVKKRPVTTTVLIGLLAVVLVYFGKEIQIKLQKRAVIKTANVQLLENNEAMLKVLSKSVDWSIRSEMMRGNMEQVDLLMTELVKDSHFQYIHLVGQDGNIMLSTNKKQEGQPIETKDVKSALAADSTLFINEGDTLITVVSPVMGFDKRLGTLVMSYTCKAIK